MDDDFSDTSSDVDTSGDDISDTSGDTDDTSLDFDDSGEDFDDSGSDTEDDAIDEDEAIDDEPEDEDDAIEDEPEDEDEAIEDEPEDEDEAIEDEPEDEDEAIEDEPEDEDEAIEDEPEDEDEAIEDELEDEDEAIEDEPEDEDEAIDDEPEDEDESIDDEPEDEDEAIEDEPEDEDEAIEDEPEDKDESIDDEPDDENEGTLNNVNLKTNDLGNNYDLNNNANNDIEDKFNTDKKDFIDELQKYVNRDPERDRPDEEYSKPKQDEIQRERIRGSEFDTRYDDSNDNKNTNLDNNNSDYSPKAEINNPTPNIENDIYNPTQNSQNDINNPTQNNQNDINNYDNTLNVDNQYETPKENKGIFSRLKDKFNEKRKIKEYDSKLPEIQNQMDDFAKREELDKYVVNKDILNKPLRESVEARGNEGINERLDEINRNLPEEKQIHNKGNIAGFNDGNKSYINVDVDTTPEATTLHENMHQISTNTYKNLYTGDIYSMSGISKNGADTQVNEGLTEYYAKKAMGDKYPGDTSVYKNNTIRSARLENLIGRDELKRAYFGNKPEILEAKFAEYGGEKYSWKKYSEACKLSVKGKTQEIRDAYNAIANDILDNLEYMKSEGDKPII